MKSRFYIKSIGVVLVICIFIWFIKLIINPGQMPVYPYPTKQAQPSGKMILNKEQYYNYFPLADGNVWEYKNMNMAELKIVKKIVSHDPESGRYYLEETLYFGSSAPGPGSVSVLVLDKEKYLREVASINPYKSQVTELYPADIILKYPLNIGTTWENETGSGGDRYIFKVLGFQDITVQAGYFKNVAKIMETVMAMDFSLQKRTKYGIGMVHYYAPNVGLIKSDFVKEKGEVNPYIELVSYTVQ